MSSPAWLPILNIALIVLGAIIAIVKVALAYLQKK